MAKKEIKRIDLKEIKDPSFLTTLNYKELNQLSSDISEYIIDITSKNGGHLSSNLGVIDATIALCYAFDFTKDKIVFDVGHQSYTYKLLTGRSLERIRQKDGISGFQRMDESPYDHFDAGHSSTSISVAAGMAIARDMNHEHFNTIAFIGDASIANGLSFEALNMLAGMQHKVIIVLNDNDMSISRPVGGLARAFRKLSTSNFYRKSKHAYKRVMSKFWLGRKIYKVTLAFKNWFKRHVIKQNIFDSLGGFSVIGPVDGHDIKDLIKAFNRAKRTDKSTVVVIKTIKGKGYKYAEEDKEGAWHGVGKFDVESGEASSSSRINWSELYSDLIYNKLKEDKKSALVVPATGLGSNLSQAFKDFPTQCYDVGIAEEHAITMAGGLSVGGIRPIISIYSTFLQRGYDEILHDLAKTNRGVTFIVDRAGLVGNDGTSHQGIFDESFLIGIPNTVVAMASNSTQVKSLFDESFKHNCPFFIRCPKEKIFVNPKGQQEIKFGEWLLEQKGQGTAIVSVGPETEMLKELIEDKNVTLYNAIFQKPMDQAAIKELLGYKKVIIYDAYASDTGFVQQLSVALMNLGFKGEIITKSVPTEFIHHASVYEQKQDLGLLPEDIVKLI